MGRTLMILRRSPVNGVVAGLLATVMLNGCGGADEPSAPSALTSAELVSEARSVCARHNDVIDDAAAALPARPSPAEIRAFVRDSVLPEYSAWIDALDALEPPAELATAWDTYIADSYATRDAIEDDPILALDPNAQEFANVNAQAEDLGLGRACYAGPTS